MDGSRQTELLGKILNQLKENSKVNPGSGGQGYNEQAIDQLNTALRRASGEMRSFSEQTKNTAGSVSHAREVLDEYGAVFGTIGLTFQQLNKASGDLLKKAAKMTGIYNIYKGLGNSVKKTVNATRLWAKEIDKADTNLKKAYATLNLFSSLLGTVLGTVGQVGMGLLSIGKTLVTTVAGAFSSAFTAAFKFSKFVMTLPIGIVNRAAEIGNAIRKEIVETIGNAAESAKEFIDTMSNSGSVVRKIEGIAIASRLAFQNVNSELFKVFKSPEGMITETTKGLQEMGPFFDHFAKSVGNSTDSILFFQKMKKGLAMSAEDTAYIMRESLKDGAHFQQTLTDVYEATEISSKRFGVNRKILSSNFFQLRKDIANFGHLSKIELTDLAAKATQMGYEVKDLMSLMNKFDTYETAAQSSAILAQSFGMNVDALALIRAENPLEIARILSDALMATGRSFDDLSFREKKLIATHTGMSQEMLMLAMNYKNTGKSYAEFKKEMENQTPEARQLRAMKRINSSVVLLRKTIDKKDFFTAFTDGLAQTIVLGTDLGKTYTDISQNMQSFFTLGLEFDSKQKDRLNQILLPFTNILNEINGIFDRNNAKKTKDSILDFLAVVSKEVFAGDMFAKRTIGNPEFKQSVKTLQRQIENIFTLENVLKGNSFFAKLARSTGKIMGMIIKTFIAFGPTLVKSLGKAILSGVELIGQILKGKGTPSKLWGEFFGFNECSPTVFRAFGKSVNEIYDYLFGTMNTKLGRREGGFLQRFLSNLTNIINDASKEGGPLDKAISDTSGFMGDFFKDMGRNLMEGLSKADDALIKVGEMIARGVAKFFGIDLEKASDRLNPAPKGTSGRAMQHLHADGLLGAPAAAENLLESTPAGALYNRGVYQTGMNMLAPGVFKATEKGSSALMNFVAKKFPMAKSFMDSPIGKRVLGGTARSARVGAGTGLTAANVFFEFLDAADKNLDFNKKLEVAKIEANKKIAELAKTDPRLRGVKINEDFLEELRSKRSKQTYAKSASRASFGTAGAILGFSAGGPIGSGFGYELLGGLSDFANSFLYQSDEELTGQLRKEYSELLKLQLKRIQTEKSLLPKNMQNIKTSEALFKFEPGQAKYHTEGGGLFGRDGELKPMFDFLKAHTATAQLDRSEGQIYRQDIEALSGYIDDIHRTVAEEQRSEEFKKLEHALLRFRNAILDDKADRDQTPIIIEADGQALFKFTLDKLKSAATNAANNKEQHSIIQFDDGAGLSKVGRPQ